MGNIWGSSLSRKTPLRAKKPWDRKGKPLERKTALTAKKPINRAGKKTKAWYACRAKLKTRFMRAGITTCELQYEGCWHDDGLGFAHSKKRRNITTEEQLEEVILSCSSCHDRVEAKPESEMAAIIRAVIAARPVEV